MERNQYLDQLEEQEQQNRLQQSDLILCQNIENLQFTHKRENDMSYMLPMSRPLNNQIRDVKQEHTMWTQTFGTRVATCTDATLTRGGNNPIPAPRNNLCAGYECFAPAYTKNFMMVPCKENTFKNYLVEDHKKICTTSHQLFNNMTKRV